MWIVLSHWNIYQKTFTQRKLMKAQAITSIHLILYISLSFFRFTFYLYSIPSSFFLFTSYLYSIPSSFFLSTFYLYSILRSSPSNNSRRPFPVFYLTSSFFTLVYPLRELYPPPLSIIRREEVKHVIRLVFFTLWITNDLFIIFSQQQCIQLRSSTLSTQLTFSSDPFRKFSSGF